MVKAGIDAVNLSVLLQLKKKQLYSTILPSKVRLATTCFSSNILREELG